MNLTRAATSKAYMEDMNDRVIEKDLPEIDHELHTVREQQKRELSKVMGRAFARGLAGLGAMDYGAKARDDKKPRTPSQLELQRESALLKEIPEMSGVMKKAQQIPLRMEYDKRSLRQDFTKFFSKQYNTESDDSDYVEQDIALMLKKV